MIYKVGDKVRVRQDLKIGKKYGCADFTNDMQMYIGKIVTIARLLWARDDSGDFGYDIVEDKGFYIWTSEMLESLAEEPKAPSVIRRINGKHNILNGLFNSDGSVDGEKLIKKLEENQVQVANGVVMNDRPARPIMPASTPSSVNDKHSILNGLLQTDGSVSGEKLMQALENNSVGTDYYEKSAMQPLEVSQVLLTREQFAGALLFNIIKYRMRSNFKGQHDSDEYKARQYAYWLELVQQGKTINPSVDIVPDGYEFKLI